MWVFERSTECSNSGVPDAYSWLLCATCKLWFTHCNEFFWSVDSHIWFTPSMSGISMTRWFHIHSFCGERSSFVKRVNYRQEKRGMRQLSLNSYIFLLTNENRFTRCRVYDTKYKNRVIITNSSQDFPF